ncbi:MAG: hypothetical protein HYY57_07605 [Candidatus Omnitrophica bacterium]|nr:hypothetical protein [Candidatus Omnitrophota bacterium]
MIDPTDLSLGYDNYAPDAQGRPQFDGNYDQSDGGLKLDGTQRKFYESTLSNTDFQALVSMNSTWTAIEGVIFTNHLFAGAINSSIGAGIRGAIVARDESISFTGSMLGIAHDLRLLDNSALPYVGLPIGVQRPQLIAWQECRPASCP